MHHDRHHRMTSRRALLLSALFAAAVVGALSWRVGSKAEPAPPPAISGSGMTPPALDTGRLMAPEEPGVSLFLDSERDLVVRYPSSVTPLRLASEMEGLGYLPTCDPAHALVCFPLDPPEYEGTNFGNAAFAILFRDDLGTERECLVAQPAEAALGAVLLGETVFASFAFGDAALSHRLDGRNYRAWREDGCYELTTRISTSAYEAYEPGTVRAFTASDEAAVRDALDRMLRSFRFQADLELL